MGLKKEKNILKDVEINSLKRYSDKILFYGYNNSYLIDIPIYKEASKDEDKKDEDEEEKEEEKERNDKDKKEGINEEYGRNQNNNCTII